MWHGAPGEGLGQRETPCLDEEDKHLVPDLPVEVVLVLEVEGNDGQALHTQYLNFPLLQQRRDVLLVHDDGLVDLVGQPGTWKE